MKSMLNWYNVQHNFFDNLMALSGSEEYPIRISAIGFHYDEERILLSIQNETGLSQNILDHMKRAGFKSEEFNGDHIDPAATHLYEFSISQVRFRS